MAQRIIVQDGIVNYSTSDPTLDINVNMSGQLNVTKELTVGNDLLASGTITTNGTQDLIISAANNVKIAPTGSILLNNVAWPTATSVSPGAFLGSSSVNTLTYYPFVIAFNGSDTLTNAQLVSTYPTAVVGQSVIGPSTVYQCVGSGLWRHLSSAAGSVTSVNVDGGITGLYTTGGPITSSGTITLNGTLNIANGGTGQTTANQAFNALAPNQTGNNGKVLFTNGTNTSWVSADSGSIYQPVLVATSSNISVSGSGQVIDGVTVPDNSRVLVGNQTTTNENGIYIASAGSWARTSDWAAGLTKYAGTQIFCTSGATFAQSVFTLSSTTQTVVVGSGIYSFLPAVSNGLGVNYALDISRGGTGQITASGAINALVPAQSGHNLHALTSNGTAVAWTPITNSFNTRTGPVTLTSADVTNALTYTPVNKAGDTVSGTLTFPNISGITVTGIPMPLNSTDVASKSYVDGVASGLYIKSSVEAGTTANLVGTYNNGAAGVGATLTANPSAAFPIIDGYVAFAGDRILVKNQTDPKQNGIYIATQITAPWILTRATDYNNSIPGQVISGSYVFITLGSTQASTGWVETAIGTGPSDAIVIGTDPIVFGQFSGAGTYLAGTGLTLTGNTFSLTNTSLTVNGVTIALGSSATVTAAAGTLTGATLAANVLNSSLTSVGTLTNLTVAGNTTTNGNVIRSVATGVTATGTNQGSSFDLTKDINVVSTVSSGTGVSLPIEVAGMEIIVMNMGANSLNVYPNSGSAAIDTLSAGAAFVLGTGTKIMFICVSGTQWYTLNSTFS